MKRIRAKDTSPEIIARKLIHSMGYGYRLHVNELPGRPDLVFPSRRKIIFVHGCFWHQHAECKEKHIPKSNVSYWKPKLQKTIKRDAENIRKLRFAGWDVLVVWECYLDNIDKVRKTVKKFLDKKD